MGDLNETQKRQLQLLLQKYQDVIAKEGEFGRIDLYQHKIYTEDGPPISQRAYCTSPTSDKIIKEEIDKGLKNGLIKPSTSPWASPVTLVKKKNRKWRFCVDYRKLNNVTKKDRYPLPLINEIIDRLGGSKWFTSIDLASGYWQVEVVEEDKEKIAFITKYGLFEYNVMPFGLCNAPATFQRLMNTALEDILWKFVMDYIDDISVYSKTWEEHLQHLEEVFKRLRKAKLKINPDKCHFGAQEIQFLEHVIGIDGIKPDPAKVEKVKNFPQLGNTTELRSFVRLISYYRRFIQDFSKISKPLFELTKKDQPYEWKEPQSKAFEILKEKLINSPVLIYLRFIDIITIRRFIKKAWRYMNLYKKGITGKLAEYVAKKYKFYHCI